VLGLFYLPISGRKLIHEGMIMQAATVDDHIEHLQAEFENAHPQDILRWAVDTYADKLAIVTSFQQTGIVT
jgi:hypothetical protein